MHRIFTTSVSSVYPLYLAKLERKARTATELDEVICWLTEYSDQDLRAHLERGTTFADFFASAQLNPMLTSSPVSSAACASGTLRTR